MCVCFFPSRTAYNGSPSLSSQQHNNTASFIGGSACGFSVDFLDHTMKWVKSTHYPLNFFWVTWVTDWANPYWPNWILKIHLHLEMAMGRVQVESTENPTHKKIVGLNLTSEPTVKFGTRTWTHGWNLAPKPAGEPIGFRVGFGCPSGFINGFLSRDFSGGFWVYFVFRVFFLLISVFLGFRVQPQVKNETYTRTWFCTGRSRVWVPVGFCKWVCFGGFSVGFRVSFGFRIFFLVLGFFGFWGFFSGFRCTRG
jgi:hypothetical protein